MINDETKSIDVSIQLVQPIVEDLFVIVMPDVRVELTVHNISGGRKINGKKRGTARTVLANLYIIA